VRLPDWPKWKIMLVMWLAVLPVMLVMILTAPEEPSSDCARADDAVHHAAAVIPGVLGGMGGHSEPDLPRIAAESSAATRQEAAAIGEPDLRATVSAVADAVQRIGRGNPSAAPHGFPDRDFIGGYQDLMAALHDVKRLCPNVGTDELPAEPPTRGVGAE
jgi:hypothetical protein